MDVRIGAPQRACGGESIAGRLYRPHDRPRCGRGCEWREIAAENAGNPAIARPISPAVPRCFPATPGRRRIRHDVENRPALVSGIRDGLAAILWRATMAKIYTRTGDGGETALFAGGRIRKDDPRLAAIGTIDELNALIGCARVALGRMESAAVELNEFCERVQHHL